MMPLPRRSVSSRSRTGRLHVEHLEERAYPNDWFGLLYAPAFGVGFLPAGGAGNAMDVSGPVAEVAVLAPPEGVLGVTPTHPAELLAVATAAASLRVSVPVAANSASQAAGPGALSNFWDLFGADPLQGPFQPSRAADQATPAGAHDSAANVGGGGGGIGSAAPPVGLAGSGPAATVIGPQAPAGAQPGAGFDQPRSDTGQAADPRLTFASAVPAGQPSLRNSGRTPLAFEANQGQTDAQVSFLARGPGYTFFLTGDGPVMSLDPSTSAAAGGVAPDVIRLHFAGANAAAPVRGLEELPGRTNYFIGADPQQWHQDVPSYAQVRVAGLYAGVDAVYYGNPQGSLEYDLVVAPGADSSVIALDIEGAQALTVDAAGALHIHRAGGDLVQHAPVVYQIDGASRQDIAGRYLVNGDRVTFAVGAHDASLPLVIDPVLAYSTYLGGNGDDEALDVAVDAAGETYVTGYTASSDFPTVDPTQIFHPSQQAFVTKFDPTGTILIYSTYLGGTAGTEQANGIAVDLLGNAYVVGQTTSSDFPVSGGAFQHTQPSQTGGTNAFVTSLGPLGGLAYSTYLGGSNTDTGLAIAVDALGQAFVTGETNSPDFPTTALAFQPALGGGSDAFVACLNSTGSALIYGSFLGGGGRDVGRGIALDGFGNAYVTGWTTSDGSNPFPTTSGAFQTAYPGGNEAGFVTEVSPDGTALGYSTFLGGGEGDTMGLAIAVDGAGSAYVTGATSADTFPTTPGAFQTSHQSPFAQTFVAKLDPLGASLVYSTYLGGDGQDKGNAIAVDAAGNAVVAGVTGSFDFPTAQPLAGQGSLQGNNDAFVTQLNGDGSGLLFSTYLGGSADDAATGVALDPSGNLYVAGWTKSSDFPTVNAFQPTHGADNGFADAFVAAITIGN